MQATSKAVMALLLGIAKVKADQPVSCMSNVVSGRWTFHISKEVQQVNLFEAKEVCTHQMPNKLQIMSQKDDFSFERQKTLKLELDDYGNVKGDLTGKWMAFYDQAFKVDLSDGTSFIANYRYALKEYVDNDPLKHGAKNLVHLETDDYTKFYSLCDKTMVGFVQQPSGSMISHPIQCFYGVKTDTEEQNALPPRK